MGPVGARKKTANAATGYSSPGDTSVGAFIIDLLLLALTFYLSVRCSVIISMPEVELSLSAKPVPECLRAIEFLKRLRLIFCPHVPELRPFAIQMRQRVTGMPYEFP